MDLGLVPGAHVPYLRLDGDRCVHVLDLGLLVQGTHVLHLWLDGDSVFDVLDDLGWPLHVLHSGHLLGEQAWARTRGHSHPDAAKMRGAGGLGFRRWHTMAPAAGVCLPGLLSRYKGPASPSLDDVTFAT